MSAIIQFLESLGIHQGNKPDICKYCGAKYPYCNWNEIIDEAPCSSENHTQPQGEQSASG